MHPKPSCSVFPDSLHVPGPSTKPLWPQLLIVQSEMSALSPEDAAPADHNHLKPDHVPVHVLAEARCRPAIRFLAPQQLYEQLPVTASNVLHTEPHNLGWCKPPARVVQKLCLPHRFQQRPEHNPAFSNADRATASRSKAELCQLYMPSQAAKTCVLTSLADALLASFTEPFTKQS